MMFKYDSQLRQGFRRSNENFFDKTKLFDVYYLEGERSNFLATLENDVKFINRHTHDINMYSFSYQA